ncbi:CpaE family protein [Kineococcus gynurae]|uniref:CpaE family protein n=1 Tax=Kineococcus gynurae TaxID=452979 RepID=A0ABV5LR69_9ACTN
MSIGVVLLVHGPAESRLARRLGSRRDLVLARRCADQAEALATIAAGIGDVLVVSEPLAAPDTDLVAAAAASGHELLVLLPGGHDHDESRRRWVQVGARHLARLDDPSEEVVRRIVLAAAGPGPEAGVPGGPSEGDVTPAGTTVPAREGATGRLLAVWGPVGSVGRSTIAVNVAAELADRGAGVLLVDVDTRGAALAQLLGVLDEAPTLLAALRAVAEGRLGAEELFALAPEVAPGLALLSHSPDPGRWREVRPSALGPLLVLARTAYDWVVVDVGGGRADDGPAGRDGVLDAVLDRADATLVVGAADPVGLQRWIRCWSTRDDEPPVPAPVAVLNRVAGSPAARREVRDVVRRHAAVAEPVLLPDDPSVAVATTRARTLVEATPRGNLRRAVAELADQLDAGLLAPAPSGI